MSYTYLINSFILSLFVSVVFANNNNNNTLSIEYEIYENIVIWGCDFFNGERGVKINIISVTGGTGNYNIVTNGNGKVNPSNVKAGEGFTYFFTESDVEFGNIGFTITDTQGNNQVMPPNLIFNLKNIFQVALFICDAPDKCTKNSITHVQADNVTADVYQSTNKIKSSADMPDGNVSYLANNEVLLDIGFHVKLISNFTADIINPCNITIE